MVFGKTDYDTVSEYSLVFLDIVIKVEQKAHRILLQNAKL